MTVTSGNQLVECQECHNLYHQECHKPQVTDKDVNDPRLVWYCARCTRQMKRMVSAPTALTPVSHCCCKNNTSSQLGALLIYIIVAELLLKSYIYKLHTEGTRGCRSLMIHMYTMINLKLVSKVELIQSSELRTEYQNY